ncbi:MULTISPECIES: PAAR domain-containing protein [Pseudomonas]|uniref:PAAR domain-containing protein n=1 Tax=Pseudomonas TaxID=286 RepID=UPI001B478E17|nr:MULTISPECIES: PAAR domain-containing protein [unclassified Pseudomonas]MBP1127130.1 putative Zn-binding protein involved in type VI secretion [Pseudomonas sp. PvP025]MDQ0400990.1 putative Zn-binding protein involved in type VI secretion [Pseudomonas sp. PvP006]
MSHAARVGDPIEHTGSLTGLLAGLAVGAIGAALIVGTGGLAAVAIIGASAAAGAGIGQVIGSLSYCNHETGHILTGSGNVHINGKPAARAHVDTAKCDDHGPGPKTLAQGSSTVYINNMPAARVDDRTVCDARISSGSGNVWIGGETETTDEISPEVPALLEWAVLGLGLASAFVLASPVIVIAGLVGGIAGGLGGNWAGGKLFGDGSNGQKLMALGGALLGGGLGAKGGKWFDARYEIKVQGLGSNLGNVKIVPKTPKATFGKATSDDYKATFFEANPSQKGKVVVHHAVEQQVQKRYPGVVKNEELHSLENLRGIPKEQNSELHLSFIRKEWNKFYRETPSATKQQLLDKATEIDNMIGSQFAPPIKI